MTFNIIFGFSTLFFLIFTFINTIVIYKIIKNNNNSKQQYINKYMLIIYVLFNFLTLFLYIFILILFILSSINSLSGYAWAYIYIVLSFLMDIVVIIFILYKESLINSFIYWSNQNVILLIEYSIEKDKINNIIFNKFSIIVNFNVGNDIYNKKILINKKLWTKISE